MVSVVIITHGLFGQELLHAAENIVGRQQNVAALAVTPITGPDELGGSIESILQSLASPDGFLFLVDMLGGTPSNIAMLKTKNVRAEIVTGVNLYMTISAFRNRPAMDLDRLAAKVADDGRRAIMLPKEMLKKKMGES